MQSKLNPYINFQGQAREAVEFYKAAFGGTLTMSTYKEGGVPHDPSEANHIMHAMLTADNGIVLMVADTPSGMEYKPGTNISLSLSGDEETQLKGYWETLSAGGTILQPLAMAPWGDTFGMFIDKFGINWLVNITAKKG